MTAECWWCQVGIAKIVANAVSDPLGCCYDCSVFACGGHAELERYKGKWLCLQSAAQAVAAGAGIASRETDDVVIESPEELEERLPAIARATEEDRAFFSAGPAEGWLYAQPDRLRDERDIQVGDPRLLGDALGIARFIERDVRERVRRGDEGEFDMLLLRRPAHLGAARPGRLTVVPGLLGELLTEAPE